jgi:hypothetical protein
VQNKSRAIYKLWASKPITDTEKNGGKGNTLASKRNEKNKTRNILKANRVSNS